MTVTSPSPGNFDVDEDLGLGLRGPFFFVITCIHPHGFALSSVISRDGDSDMDILDEARVRGMGIACALYMVDNRQTNSSIIATSQRTYVSSSSRIPPRRILSQRI